jgi:hypothetical protein
VPKFKVGDYVFFCGQDRQNPDHYGRIAVVCDCNSCRQGDCNQTYELGNPRSVQTSLIGSSICEEQDIEPATEEELAVLLLARTGEVINVT